MSLEIDAKGILASACCLGSGADARCPQDARDYTTFISAPRGGAAGLVVRAQFVRSLVSRKFPDITCSLLAHSWALACREL